jgi:hypothetical protein
MSEPNHYDAVIADLEAQREKITTTIEMLQGLRGFSNGTSKQGTDQGRAEMDSDIRSDAFFGMTIADAARKYLGIVKKAKSTSDIAVALEAGGLKHASKDFNTTLRSIIGPRRDEFVRVNGDWGLTEWYPGMRNKDRKGKPSTTAKATVLEPVVEEIRAPEKVKRVSVSKNQVPTGNGRKIVILLIAGEKNYSAIEVAKILGSDKPASIASLLSEMAKKGRIGRGDPSGYKANEETQALYNLMSLSKEEEEFILEVAGIA